MFNQNCCNRNNGNMFGRQGQGCPRQMMDQVIEPTITNCVQKDFYHEVPHV